MTHRQFRSVSTLFALIAAVRMVSPGSHPAAAQEAPPDTAAAAPSVPPAETIPRPDPFDYGGYNSLLERYVRDGLVDYKAWKKSGTAELDAVLQDMAAYPFERVFARDERLAFLVNAYNALVIRSVLEAYPVKSVKEIPGFFDLKKHKLSGGPYTLDEIEKTLIPRNAESPLHHFAVVVGGRGSPPLGREAWTAENLTSEGSNNLRTFSTDSTNVSYDAATNTLYVSELFGWYAADFDKGDQTLPKYLTPFLSLGIAVKVMQQEPRIQYLPFNWKLNEASKPGQSR